MNSVISVEIQKKGLILHSETEQFYFNYYWLRDNCASSFDDSLRERTFDITSLINPPTAKSAGVSEDTLKIEWNEEDHCSVYSIEWLMQFKKAGKRSDPAAHSRTLWRANHSRHFQRFTHKDVLENMQSRTDWARALIEEGIAVITEMENSDISLTKLANCLGWVRPSVAGDYFDVRVHLDPVNLSFTAKALEMHTDTPAEELAPGIQFLHCRQNTVSGGESLFLDGAAVAEDFRKQYPAEFKLLSNHEIPFYYDHDKFDWRAHQRVIELDRDGSVSGLTISQHMADAFDLPQELLDSYYPAFCLFLSKVNDPLYINRFRMNAGECYVFDNHRIVHGREAYTAGSGERYLRGCYIDRGELRSTYRTLVKNGFGKLNPTTA